MIYDKYKARISKLAKFLLVVRRYRILIMSVLLTVLAITTVLLSTNGMVYGDSKCPSTIPYGQTLEYDAHGFLSKVYFEFYDPATKTWSTEQPTAPGKYKVRAVSTNIFGDKKYGDVHDFTIVPKEIPVKVSVDTIEYGALPPVTADLVDEGSSITCSMFDYIGLGAETVQVIPRAEAVKIIDKDGVDITSYYSVRGEATFITFTARTVMVSITDIEHVYDGQVFTSEDYTVEQGSFLATDTVVGTFTGSVETAGEQSINNATFKVYRGEADVTSYYKIICAPGVLTVAKRPLLLQTSSANHTYDGQEFSAPDYTIAEDTPIAEGHRVVVDDYAKLTEVGTVPNTLTVRILDANDVDVTENYEISFPEDSILSVSKREISITSETAEKFYDGAPLIHHVASVDEGYSIADGQYFVADWTGTLTEQGDVANEFTVKIYIDDGDGDDTTHGVEVTSNYTISYNYGRLVVGYTYVTFKTASASRQYDGTPLKAEECVELTINGVVAELPDIFELVLTDFAEIAIVGKTENTAQYKIVRKDDLDGEHNQNYIVTPEWGTLTVTQREISVSAVNVSKVYDGTPLESDEVEWSMDIDMPTDHVLTADLIGSQTYFGTSVNELLEENITITYNGQDVTDYFTFVSLQNGEITITTRYLYLTTHTHTWTYDGLAHKDFGTECDANGYDNDDLKDGVINGIEYFLLPDGHSLAVDDSTAPEITNYSESGMPNTLSFFVYANVNGVDTDVTADNFTIVFNEVDAERGKLFIEKRELGVLSDSAVNVYDGLVLKAENYQIVSGSLAPNQTIVDVSYHSGITDVQVVENEWTFRIEDQNNVDVTDNYEIDKKNGTLEITPRYIWITTHEHSWVYDGLAHQDRDADCTLGGYSDNDLTAGIFSSPDGSASIEYMLLAKNQSLVVATATSVTDVAEGAVDNELTFNVLDVNDQDVTKNYIFRYTNQTIWIDRRPIEIQANDVTWIYDGNAHYDGDGMGSCKQYTNADNVTQNRMSVVSGENIALDTSSFSNTAKITDVGNIANNPLFVVWRTRNGILEISDNYTITVLPGTLTVEKRDIWVTTHDVTWEYDGRAHYENDGYHTFYAYGNNDLTIGWQGGTEYKALVGNHTLEIDTTNGQAAVLNVSDSGNPNEIELCVYANGVSVNDNYRIRYTYGTLTITPRKITITAKSGKTVYNGLYQTMPQNEIEDDIYAQLAPNQTLYAIKTLGVNEKNADVYVHEIVQDSAIIHDRLGKDVTVNYAITYKNGTYTIEKRKINILTHDHTWQYDAEPHYDDCKYGEVDLTLPNSTYFDTLDELPLGGHSLKTKTYTIITNVWESWTSGLGNNAMTFDVLDNNGAVVTDNYAITYTQGKLIITPLEIVLIGDSLTEMYDGTEHVIPKNMYTIQPGLLSTVNHTHSVARLDVSGAKRTDVGMTENTVYENTLQIVDEGNNDVTGNYLVVDVQHGTLEITKRPIYVVKTHTCTWEYDGIEHYDGDGKGDTAAYGNTELANDGVKCFGLVLDHELKPIVGANTAKIQNVLDSGKTNTVEFAVFYANGNKNTNYEIFIDANCDFGTLHVTPRAAIITSESDQKDYDGTPLTCDKIADQTGVLTNLGHNAVANATGSQTNAYTATDDTKGESENTFNPQIFDANGKDVTSNYAITKVNGTLTVNKRPITVTSDDAKKVYDGTPLTKHSCTTSYQGENDGLVLDHVITPQYTGEITFVGTAPNTFTATTNDIVDGAGNSVGKNYIIGELIEGELEITPRKINITTISKNKVYDAKPLIAHNEYELLDETTLAVGDTLTVSTKYTEIINVGEIEHSFLNPNNPNTKIVWKDGVTDVTYCYEITYADDLGVLKITPCEVVIQTGGAMKVYDGTPLGNPSFTVDGLPEGHTYKNMYTVGSQTYPGWSDNVLNGDWYIVDSKGVDVTNSGNFEYYYDYGILEVQAEEIIGALAIKPVDLVIGKNTTPPTSFLGSVEDANNGVALWVLQRSGGCTYTAEIKTVHNGVELQTEIEEFHLYDVNGKEITYLYEIEYIPGKIEYQQDINIRIQLPFKEKVYDGTPLSYDASDEASISVTKPSDVEVRVNLAGLSRTDAGTFSKKELMERTSVTRNGVSIMDACTIDFGSYNLVVRPREIIVETQSASKIYDGTPLRASEIPQPINLLEGHRLMGKDERGNWIELESPCEITGIGTIKNFLDLKECKVMDEENIDEYTKKNLDVTNNYLIVIKQGELKVKG